MKEYILNLSWWCDLLTFQQGIHAEWRECDQCDQNTTCAPQCKYGPRMQCYKPVLPIVTLFSQTKDAQESTQARGATLFHNATCHKGRSPIIINTGGIGEANKEWNMICAIQAPALGTISTGSGRAGGGETVWGSTSNRVMSGMKRSGRSRSRAEVVSNSNRPRGNGLGETDTYTMTLWNTAWKTVWTLTWSQTASYYDPPLRERVFPGAPLLGMGVKMFF